MTTPGQDAARLDEIRALLAQWQSGVVSTRVLANAYIENVPWLLAQLVAARSAEAHAPSQSVEEARGYCAACGLPEPFLIHRGYDASAGGTWTKSPCDGACGSAELHGLSEHTHHPFRVLVWPTPAIGEVRKCLACAYHKPWGTFDTRTGATLCKECRDKAAAIRADERPQPRHERRR